MAVAPKTLSALSPRLRVSTANHAAVIMKACEV